MEVVTRLSRMRELAAERGGLGEAVAFVPTMGALHEGHLSLVRLARSAAPRVVLSIYVNPLQFGPGEDFESYPRDVLGDTERARAAGVDALLLPETKDLYPDGFRTFVEVEGLGSRLCGRSRPGHFRGVATVVAKLLAIVAPQVLVLGCKDAQQLVILRRMVTDLNLPVEVLAGPTAREDDGLARSSRNLRLSPEERRVAPRLRQALGEAERAFAAGERQGDALAGRVRTALASEPLIRLDYAEVVDTETLEPLADVSRRALVAAAAFVGKTRLIDNVTLDIADVDRTGRM